MSYCALWTLFVSPYHYWRGLLIFGRHYVVLLIVSSIKTFTQHPVHCSSMGAGLRTVILLSFVLAVGFLLIILSCALWQNWLPLLVALTFVLAPLPNAVFPHCCGADEYATSFEEGSGPVDFGRFITALIVVTGFAFPIVLAHSEIINPKACAMSIVGGGLVYGTILAYAAAFKQENSEYD